MVTALSVFLKSLSGLRGLDRERNPGGAVFYLTGNPQYLKIPNIVNRFCIRRGNPLWLPVFLLWFPVLPAIIYVITKCCHKKYAE